VTTVDACEQTRPPAGDRLKDRGALVLASARGVGRAIGRSLADWPEERYGDTLAARSPCTDDYLEDPHDLPEIAQRLGDHLERVSYDSPICSAQDIGATPLAARVVNVKPSRIGSLRELFEVYARCARDQRPMYGGGMGELGVRRGQIELLAALFHPDAPNDVAPSAYTRRTLQATCQPAR